MSFLPALATALAALNQGVSAYRNIRGDNMSGGAPQNYAPGDTQIGVNNGPKPILDISQRSADLYGNMIGSNKRGAQLGNAAGSLNNVYSYILKGMNG